MIVRIVGDPDELVGWSNVFDAEWSPKRYCQGPRYQEVVVVVVVVGNYT